MKDAKLSQLLAETNENSHLEDKYLSHDFPKVGYQSPSGCKETITKYLKGKALFERKYCRHPGRTANYSMSVSPAPIRGGIHADAKATDWFYLEFIRQVSNVCTQFCQELGDVFWGNTRIEAAGLGLDDIRWLTSLLRERPAIHKGVKMVSIGMNMNEDWCHNYLHEFAECCEILSTLPDLQWIQLYVTVLDIHVEKAVKGEDNFKHLSGSRKIKVTQGWDIDVHIWVEASWRISWDESCEIEKTQEQNYKHIIEDIMKPDSLRIDKPTTEMSEYLSRRPQQ